MAQKNDLAAYRIALAQAFARNPPCNKPVSAARVPAKRTQLAADAPAPATADMIAKRGSEPAARALEAWAARVRGAPIVDVAHSMGLTIEDAKVLIREAHGAIAEDLKTNLDLNRQLDLDRIDGLLQVYYPLARSGDADCANVTLKCLQQRSKLTGIEPQPDPGRSNPAGVLVWIQQQLPSINRIVDALPLELPPGAP
jgi:hypothetical protein